MKKVRFSDALNIHVIENRFQIKEHERFYTYYLSVYMVCIIGFLFFLFYQNYPIAFFCILLASFMYGISQWRNGWVFGNPYGLSLVPLEILEIL